MVFSWCISPVNYQSSSTKPREFLSLTGLEHEEFRTLLPHFREALSACPYTLEGKHRQKPSTNYSNSPLPTSEDKLFFILVYFKQYPTQSYLGSSFGMTQPKANVWIHYLSPVLQEALSTAHLSPAREAGDLNHEPGSLFSHDGTERPIQRPKEDQKTYYSGKKKAHTVKNNVLANEDCVIIF